jgi:cytochrome c oxidase cbb3-type subunit 3
MRWLRGILVVGVAGVMCWGALSCKREERGFRVEPPAADTTYTVAVTDFHVGGAPSNAHVKNPYEGNALAMATGQQLYSAYNCGGCHFHGGGGIGPPLMDDTWIYGGESDQIFSTIIEGRPNGMPSYRGKIPDNQVWAIAAYVRSMGGNASKDAAPGRTEDMQLNAPENTRPKQGTNQTVLPKSSEMPG